LNHNELKADAGAALFQFLKAAPQLKELRVSNNMIGDEGGAMLA